MAETQDADDSLLSFVHIVKENDEKAHGGATREGATNGRNDCDNRSDEEFDPSEDSDCGIDNKNAGDGTESSDEEYEFE